MKKEEMLAILKAHEMKESNALSVKKAEDTLANIDMRDVKAPVSKGEGLEGLTSELPTQKGVEKVVNNACPTLVPADKDGVSKNGGESDKMEDGRVEAERKKEDNSAKDVINVSTRKVEENSEVNNELLAQLQEAAQKNETLKAKIAEINSLCEAALKKQAEQLTKEHAKEMNTVFEAVIAEGEKLEKELTESAKRNEKMYKTAQRLYENSNKLNKVLLEAVKKAQPERKFARYQTPGRRAVESLCK